MFKVKHERTADCVVAGFRWHKKGPVVGSLLLGLYDENGKLQHVGVSASFSMERRRELLDELAPYRLESSDAHPLDRDRHPQRIPGAMVSRWNAKKDLTFEPLDPKLVVEVAYDHMEGRRFRHAQFRRWRYDRDPESCTYEQLGAADRVRPGRRPGRPRPELELIPAGPDGEGACAWTRRGRGRAGPRPRR